MTNIHETLLKEHFWIEGMYKCKKCRAGTPNESRYVRHMDLFHKL